MRAWTPDWCSSATRGRRGSARRPRAAAGLQLRALPQSEQLPMFDTGLPDLNLTELFRTNRYVG